MADLFLRESRFDDAHAHVERAKSHAIDGQDQYNLGRATELRARVWYKEGRLKEAESEILRALAALEGIGAMRDVEICKGGLRYIEEGMRTPAPSGESLETTPLPTPAKSSFSVRDAGFLTPCAISQVFGRVFKLCS